MMLIIAIIITNTNCEYTEKLTDATVDLNHFSILSSTNGTGLADILMGQMLEAGWCGDDARAAWWTVFSTSLGVAPMGVHCMGR